MKNFFTTITFVAIFGAAVSARADSPDKKAPVHGWTPVQQYMGNSARGDYGYIDLYGAAVLADELGDKLSMAGRLSYIEECMKGAKPDATASLQWAMCGQDVKDFDPAKLEAELVAEKVDAGEKKRIVEEAAQVIAEAKKVGAAIEAAAKSDKGLTAVLALGTTARTEWAAFAQKNKDQLAMLDKLQDAVRANKEGLGGACLKTAAPAFQKLVHVSKPPWQDDGDIMDFYYRHLPETTEAYISTLTYAACVLALTDKGRGPYTVAANRPIGAPGMARRGPRSLTAAKAYDDAFQPKFADRDFNVSSVKSLRGKLVLVGTDLVSSIGTPTYGKVAKIVKKDDELSTVSFAGDQVEECLQWKETSKVQQVTNGNVSYEKVCVKRGMVDNQEGATDVPTVLLTGMAKGIDVVLVFGFPVVAYKSKEKVLTAIWGVAK